ncbi:hypothetical protein DsansV1_C03g0033401 [Dioscorea sansibarensis]
MEDHNTTCSPASSPEKQQRSTLNYDVVVILAAMICALVCALGLNTMLQCVVRCTRRALTEPAGWVAARRMNAGLKMEEVVALPVATYAVPAAGSPASSSSRLSHRRASTMARQVRSLMFIVSELRYRRCISCCWRPVQLTDEPNKMIKMVGFVWDLYAWEGYDTYCS